MALSACVGVQIQDGRPCSFTGALQAGMDCSHLIGPSVDTLTLAESVEFLTPQPERTCAPSLVPGVCSQPPRAVPAVVLPARSGAVALSSDDVRAVLTELAVMCRRLGKSCEYETHRSISRLTAALK